jgi:hypothetical protein
MDYHNRISYRYEHVPQPLNRDGIIAARSVMGNWPKEDFVMFIYHGLFKE